MPGNQRNYFSGSKYGILFFWTSVCFSVTWGGNLPGLLKHRRCGREAFGTKFLSKTGKSYRGNLHEPGAPPPSVLLPASASRTMPSQGPHPAASTQRHKKAFPSPTHSLGQFGSILKNPMLAAWILVNRSHRLFCLQEHTHLGFLRWIFL